MAKFFEQELPVEFRHGSPRASSLTEAASTAPRLASTGGTDTEESSSGVMGGILAVVLCCLGLMVAVMQPEKLPTRSPGEIAENLPAPVVTEEIPETTTVLAQENNGIELEMREGAELVNKSTIETPEGKLEQRSQRVWTELEVYDPESGSQTDLMMQELNIEFFPIENDESSDKK